MTQTEQVQMSHASLPEALREAIRDLVESNRDGCLWFMRESSFPEDIAGMVRVLEQIQRHGDLKAFQRAGELIQWLSQSINEPSVNS